jgi:hypothetical protein
VSDGKSQTTLSVKNNERVPVSVYSSRGKPLATLRPGNIYVARPVPYRRYAFMAVVVAAIAIFYGSFLTNLYIAN